MEDNLILDSLESENTDNQESIENEPEVEELQQQVDEQPTKTEGVKETGSFYSPEEFKEFLKKSPLHMDRNKVPPEYLDFYDATVDSVKSMQADYTRKTMELAEQRKKLEEQQLSPEERFYREYSANPLKMQQEAEALIASIKSEIKQAKLEGDVEKEVRLQDKIDLIETSIRKAELRRQYEDSLLNHTKNMYTSLQNEIVKEIPNYFSDKIYHVSKHLVDEGIHPGVVNIMADPTILDMVLKTNGIADIDGVTAAKQIIMFANKAFERANAAASAAKKEKKNIPHTGSSFSSENESSSNSDEFSYADALKIVTGGR